jgi:hypothetical protein
LIEWKPAFTEKSLQSQEYRVKTNVKLPLINGNFNAQMGKNNRNVTGFFLIFSALCSYNFVLCREGIFLSQMGKKPNC